MSEFVEFTTITVAYPSGWSGTATQLNPQTMKWGVIVSFEGRPISVTSLSLAAMQQVFVDLMREINACACRHSGKMGFPA